MKTGCSRQHPFEPTDGDASIGVVLCVVKVLCLLAFDVGVFCAGRSELGHLAAVRLHSFAIFAIRKYPVLQ